ncbi:MAG: PAS domain-containing protein [Desulfovibrio sp.]|nr:MAG: PAS domain-containing protein [Desulfovibrio sp.]
MSKEPTSEDLRQELDSLRDQVRQLKQVVQQRQWTRESMARSEREKEMILNAISDVVIFHDVEQTILWANQAAADTMSATPAELVGKKCYTLWNQRDEPCTKCAVLRSMRDKAPRQSESVSPDDTEWMVKGFPVFNEAGDVVGCVEVAQDVSARKREMEAHIRAKELAEEGNRTKSEFLANMSHELRSPMNAILGMLDLALDTNLDEEQQDMIRTALNAGEGLLDIINDILDFSRLEAEKVQVVQDTFSFGQSLEAVLKVFAGQAEEKGISLDVSVYPSVSENIWGDERRIRQILFNLVGNAIKFTAEGEVAVEAWLATANRRAEQIRLLITVTDTGIGIPDQAVAAVFDPFTQANWSKSRKYEGTGLGLSIVKRLIALLGGDMCVVSEQDQGTAMWLSLPVTLA